jgi:hypothetical protein
MSLPFCRGIAGVRDSTSAHGHRCALTNPTVTFYVNGAAAGSASPEIKPDQKVRTTYTLMPTHNSSLLGRKEDTRDKDSSFQGQFSDFCIYTPALALHPCSCAC